MLYEHTHVAGEQQNAHEQAEEEYIFLKAKSRKCALLKCTHSACYYRDALALMLLWK